MRRSALLTALVFLGIGGGAEKQYRPSPTGCKPCPDGVRTGNEREKRSGRSLSSNFSHATSASRQSQQSHQAEPAAGRADQPDWELRDMEGTEQQPRDAWSAVRTAVAAAHPRRSDAG